MQPRDPSLRPGSEVEGFLVHRVAPIGDVAGVAYELEHLGSGARLLHLHCDDEENLFSIAVSTRPPDDTGVAHVLEHMVLDGGSRAYPVRFPMREMLGRSLATYVKAQTHRDHTRYTVASALEADLFNLAAVVCDAVFHPRLSEESFRRDGHHVWRKRPGDAGSGLAVRGVVYSEMEGLLGSPERWLQHCAARELLPDTIYGHAFAGTPEHILDLTYDQLVRYHEANYHPGNALFLTVGDIPTLRHLEFLAGRLESFERWEVSIEVERQPRWSQPRTWDGTYPVAEAAPLTGRTFALLSWLAGDGCDAVDFLTLHLLDLILLGHDASPLRQALAKAELGRDLLSVGLSRAGPEATFQIGLEGTEPDRVDAFAELVLEALDRIAAGEIEPGHVRAAFRRVAYDQLEIRANFPVQLSERVLMSWPYGGDPCAFLRLGEHLAACARRYEGDPQLFNRLIRERFIDNPHRLTMGLRPARNAQSAAEEAASRRLAELRARLSPEALERVVEEAEARDRRASEPNRPEALASLPRLSLADLPSTPRHPRPAVEELNGGAELLHNEVFTGGINYLHVNLDLAGLPAGLLSYLPRYVDAFEHLGAAGMSYEQMARREAEATGGLSCGLYLRPHAEDLDRLLMGVRVRVKALDSQLDAALQVLADRLFALDPGDAPRLREVLVRSREGYMRELLDPGFGTALLLATRRQTRSQRREYLMSGLCQLELCSRLCDRFDDSAGELMQSIEAIRELTLDSSRLTASFTGSADSYRRVRAAVVTWIERMRDAPVPDSSPDDEPSQEPVREGVIASVPTGHCALTIPAWHCAPGDGPLLALAGHLLQFGYVLPEIRARGKAYGAWSYYDPTNRLLVLGSQNDPQVARTLEVFDGIRDHVRHCSWTQAEVESAVIGMARRTTRPTRPGQLAAISLHQHLAGHTPRLAEERYARLLGATAAEVKRAALEMLDAGEAHSSVCVVGNREMLAEANRWLGDRPLRLREIIPADHQPPLAGGTGSS